jgi:formate dehydrogenase iron-sulfur subunit
METQNRRNFLKIAAGIGAGAAAVAVVPKVKASPKNILSDDRMGVLVDTTVCIGCRNCEWACKTAHGLPAKPLESFGDRSVFKKSRRPDDTALTVVNEYKNPRNELLPINVKVQCMHCDHPACVSACIVGAFTKDESGAVTWNSDKCIGCRYCMVACPFQIPTFEFQTAIQPNIKKCDFCRERTKEGNLPACVGICPVEALTYGPRSEVMKIARDKIKRNPGNYINRIYGDKELEGTGWVYLANRKFEDLGLPKLPDKPAPGVSESIQHGIFAYFVPPILFYSLLGSIMWLSKKRNEARKEDEVSHES